MSTRCPNSPSVPAAFDRSIRRSTCLSRPFAVCSTVWKNRGEPAREGDARDEEILRHLDSAPGHELLPFHVEEVEGRVAAPPDREGIDAPVAEDVLPEAAEREEGPSDPRPEVAAR